MGSTLDLLPSFCNLAGARVPNDRPYDGFDLTAVLRGKNESPRSEMFFYHGFAARKGDYKLYFGSNNPIGYPEKVEKLEKLKLFNLSHDPSERFDLVDKYPDVVKEIEQMVINHKSGVIPGPTQLEKIIGK